MFYIHYIYNLLYPQINRNIFLNNIYITYIIMKIILLKSFKTYNIDSLSFKLFYIITMVTSIF